LVYDKDAKFRKYELLAIAGIGILVSS